MSNIDHPSSINRDYIRLLQAMRRFIREEFTTNIRMTQENAIEQLLHFSEQSRNRVLLEMGKELRELVQQLPIAEEQSDYAGQKVRYYRGAAIAIDEEQHAKKIVATTLMESPKRIYRGQVIGG